MYIDMFSNKIKDETILLNLTAFILDIEQQDYDLDSGDSTFASKLGKKMEIAALQF